MQEDIQPERKNKLLTLSDKQFAVAFVVFLVIAAFMFYMMVGEMDARDRYITALENCDLNELCERPVFSNCGGLPVVNE